MKIVKAVKIVAGVANGKVLLWHDYGANWNGSVAAGVYSGPMKAALIQAWPKKNSHLVLEDNDPTGFKSGKGEEAKVAAKINVLELPRRSPDLNVLDYAIWKAVSTNMRRQERSFPSRKRETRNEYIARLRRTALRLPRTTIEKSIASMVRRCELLYRAKGRHFEEGGKQKLS